MTATAAASSLPVVVPMGFAGARVLSLHTMSEAETTALHQGVAERLKKEIQAIPAFLGFKPHHFLCGVSQIAIGGDMLFTQVCQELQIPQRIFLPQPREDYLAAQDSQQRPDFNEEQQEAARRLLGSGHIIQERVICHSNDRHARFHEVNHEILNACEIFICVLRDDLTSKPGGTREAMQAALLLGKPVLELVVEHPEEMPPSIKSCTWHNTPHSTPRVDWSPPVMPHDLETGSLKITPADAEAQARGHALNVPAPAPSPSPAPGAAVVVGAGAGTASVSAEEETKRQNGPLVTADFLARHADGYRDTLKVGGSRQADRWSLLFKISALVIVGTHFAATVLATFALMSHQEPCPVAAHAKPEVAPAEAHADSVPGSPVATDSVPAPAAVVAAPASPGDHASPASAAHGDGGHDDHTTLYWLLGGELVLLLVGLWYHRRVHRRHLVRVWSTARVVAEISRSVAAMREIHSQLEYLFTLPFSPTLRPLLRTLHTFHLAGSRKTTDWEKARATYDLKRIEHQTQYYGRQLARAKKMHQAANLVFHVASVGALCATLVKLLAVSHSLPCPLHGLSGALPGPLGMLAILLPVAAVGALSLAASFDLEARVHTYQEILSRLKEHRPLVKSVMDEATFTRLALRTEALLLGETANWASRRFFTSVT